MPECLRCGGVADAHFSICDNCIEKEGEHDATTRTQVDDSVELNEPQAAETQKPQRVWKFARIAVLLCALAATFGLYRNYASGSTWNGRPSIALGRKVITQRIERDANGGITLRKFTKLDGKRTEIHGQPIYHMEYEAEIAFVQDGSWLRGNPSLRNPRFAFTPRRFGSGGLDGFVSTLEGAVNVTMFRTERVKGELVFEKTERGWKSDDGITY